MFWRNTFFGGRLHNAQIAEHAKHPILLSAKHPLAALLAVAYHQKYMHTGPEHLLSILRERFWIIGGRNLTKLVFHRCHKIFKAKPTLVQQSVADLPTSRVTSTRPFAVSGVDYCGPPINLWQRQHVRPYQKMTRSEWLRVRRLTRKRNQGSWI